MSSPNGITINNVCPGATRTDINRAALSDPEYEAKVIKKIPAGFVAQPEDRWETMAAERPRGTRLVRYIDNHDIATDCGERRVETRRTTRGVNAALAMILTLDGVPFLYNGHEIADTARHSIYARLAIDWDNEDTPTGQARFAFCQRLCAMRHTERALTHGAVIWLDNSQPDSVLSFVRRSGRQELLSLVNFSNRPLDVQVVLPNQTADRFRPLLGQGNVTVTPDDPNIHLEGFGYCVGKRLASEE